MRSRCRAANNQAAWNRGTPTRGSRSNRAQLARSAFVFSFHAARNLEIIYGRKVIRIGLLQFDHCLKMKGLRKEVSKRDRS